MQNLIFIRMINLKGNRDYHGNIPIQMHLLYNKSIVKNSDFLCMPFKYLTLLVTLNNVFNSLFVILKLTFLQTLDDASHEQQKIFSWKIRLVICCILILREVLSFHEVLVATDYMG